MKLNGKLIIILLNLFYYFELKFCITAEQNNINGININYIRGLKKVVYTILFGKYDNVHNLVKEKGYDYFMLTDQRLDNQSKINWTILSFRPKKKYKNKIYRIKKQRFYKTHPHLLFQNYDLSIYVDASYAIKGNLDEFLLRILSQNKSIYMLEHPCRNTINNEFSAVVKYNKDKVNNVVHIKNIYNEEKFPDDNGLAETCLIIRKHNDFECQNFMEQWFQQIKLYSHRDQLSFNYIWWKTKSSIIKYIPKEFTNIYFQQFPKHLKEHRHKK